jgi:hypothetical protein
MTATSVGETAGSWLSMKSWVKAWLFFLNGVFLAAFGYLPEPSAGLTLVAYLAFGPLAWFIIRRQRGITRILGAAHLVPWVPLCVYLALRLTSSWVGPQINFDSNAPLTCFVAAVLVSVLVCLGFDIVDMLRWLKGERYVLGSPESIAVGACDFGPDRILTTDGTRLLRLAWVVNGGFSCLCGAIIALDATPLARLLSIGETWPLVVVGLGLLPFGARLFHLSGQERLRPLEARIIVGLDILWVALSAALMSADVFGAIGNWIVGGVAAIVLAFALAQIAGISKWRNTVTASKAIARTG